MYYAELILKLTHVTHVKLKLTHVPSPHHHMLVDAMPCPLPKCGIRILNYLTQNEGHALTHDDNKRSCLELFWLSRRHKVLPNVVLVVRMT